MSVQAASVRVSCVFLLSNLTVLFSLSSCMLKPSPEHFYQITFPINFMLIQSSKLMKLKDAYSLEGKL